MKYQPVTHGMNRIFQNSIKEFKKKLLYLENVNLTESINGWTDNIGWIEEYYIRAKIIGKSEINSDTIIVIYNYNAVVSLNANPQIGYQFEGWSGDITDT